MKLSMNWRPVLFAASTALVAGCSQNSAPPPAPPVQVVAVAAQQKPVTERISLVGTTAANEFVAIKNEIDGRIETINFDEGKPVQKGQLLIKLDQGKLAASLQQAEANARLSDANLKRSETLFANKTISQQEFDQATSRFEADRAALELVRQQLKDTTIFAPFDGVMGARLVSAGQVIAKSTELTSVVSLDPIKVELKVPERFVSQLRVGQTIAITVATYPEEKFQGEVYFIDPRMDETTRTALLKAKVANADQRLKPGMFGNLDLSLRVRDRAIVIPESAIMYQGDRASVFVVDAQQTAQLRPVKVGLRLVGETEIAEGLNPGELVVAEGFQKLQPGAKVILSNAKK